MLIEIAAPASLPLGLVRLPDQTGLVGITLQHPPVHLFAQAYPGLNINGARADVGYAQALDFLAYHDLPHRALVEIELAIPAFMGLSSEAILGLTLSRALAWRHDRPLAEENAWPLAQALGLTPAQALAVWSFNRGGLLLVETTPGPDEPPALLDRAEIAHPERDAWAFVFLFPRVSDEQEEQLGPEDPAAYLPAGAHLSPETERLVQEVLWPAVAQDDLAAFGQGLIQLQALTRAAVDEAGLAWPSPPDSEAIFALMQSQGAVAWGQSLTGLGLWGLVRGGQASRKLRLALRRQVGPFGGTVMATITANAGAQHAIRDDDLNRKRLNPVKPPN